MLMQPNATISLSRAKGQAVCVAKLRGNVGSIHGTTDNPLDVPLLPEDERW